MLSASIIFFIIIITLALQGRNKLSSTLKVLLAGLINKHETAQQEKITKLNTYIVWEPCTPERIRDLTCTRGPEIEQGF